MPTRPGSAPITVVIPTIPPRLHLLQKAVDSVKAQNLRPECILERVDRHGDGAPATRGLGLASVRTPWTAFLDDDDMMEPDHLDVLWNAAEETGADYVYSYFTVMDALGRRRLDLDPLNTFGKPFDPGHPVQTTITTLVRTELAQSVGFSIPDDIPPTPDGNRAGEDWAFLLGCLDAGATVAHAPQRTWLWRWHGANTSGQPWTTRTPRG